MGCIAREEELAQLGSPLERGLEQRNGRRAVATRSELAAALEIHPNPRDPFSGQRFRLLQQRLARLEVIAQSLYTRELTQDLGAPCIRVLTLELPAQSRLGSVEVVEIPERPQAVSHAATLGLRI